MENQILVSIIVPVYNVEAYVKECINSIRYQTYPNIEIIIIDDGSTDNSRKICEEIAVYDERIQVISQQNQGVVCARGKGIAISSGEYIAFVDADDWIERNMIEFMLNQIQGADLVSVGVYEQISFDKVVKRLDKFPEGVYCEKEQMSHFLKKMIYDEDRKEIQPFTPWSVNKLYHSNLVKEVYGEVTPQITFAEDSVFLYKYLLKCHSIVINHQCLYYYRYRKESVMHSANYRMLIDINYVYLALVDDFRKHELQKCLLFQLQKWIVRMSCLALNYYMEFDERVYVPEFIADISYLEDKKIILYGAGKMGQIAYRQLNDFEYSVILWVDKAYKNYQDKGMNVVSPKEIIGKKYDLILIAVNDTYIVENIKKELQSMGIQKELLLWKKPMYLF